MMMVKVMVKMMVMLMVKMIEDLKNKIFLQESLDGSFVAGWPAKYERKKHRLKFDLD